MIVHKLDNNTGKILDTYKTLREAAEKNNCSVSGIREACVFSYNGRLLKGYRWFAEDENNKRNYYKIKVNERVLERRKEARKRRERVVANNPNTLKLVCNKCNQIGRLNQFTTIISLKEDDGFIVVPTEDHKIIFRCCNCNTEIKI